MKIATAPKRNSKQWAQSDITWDEFVDWSAQPGAKKESGNYLFGTLSRPERSKTTIVSRDAITLDADDEAPADLPDRVEMMLGCAALVHTTYSSTPEQPKYRIVIPVDRSLLPDEYVHAAIAVMRLLGGVELFDASCSEPERYMFKPATADPMTYRRWVFEGPWLSADALLEDFDADLAGVKAPRSQKRSPFDIDGVVGAFNRAYSFEDAIDKFELPYTPAGSGRWSLNGTRAVAGLNVIGEGLVYSHHITDPAYGSACSAFDLVRVHLFGADDIDQKAGTPVNRLPSNKAMLEFASQDERVLAEIVGEDFKTEAGEIVQEYRWITQLSRRDKDGMMFDRIGNWDLILANDPVLASLRYNSPGLQTEATENLPWRKLRGTGGPGFDDKDRTAFAAYLERAYSCVPTAKRVDYLVDEAARRNWYDPVQEYLESLPEWDGIPRLEESLPGVVPTDYTRMVARKALCSAVARVLEPGCKADLTLVLFGLEGIGKTWWIERMSRDHSSTLGFISSKDTLATMQRSWIMMADEGFSLRKADSDQLKEFLTRRVDVFRLPYDREVKVYPRRCVIWATTNDEIFLRRQQGNRRFLIVRCVEKVNFDQLTDDYVDQVWAEALSLWRSGETLYLDDEQMAVSAAERDLFTEEDAVAGLVEQYLDTPIPDNWDELSPEARVLHISNIWDGFEPVSQTQIKTVCTLQLWVEALGKERGDYRRADLLDLNTIMRQLPNWRAVPGRVRVPNYGPQSVFERIDPTEVHWEPAEETTEEGLL